MGDPEGKKSEQDKVRRAIEEIAQNEAGVIFFQWMASVCFFHRSTITADPQRQEINPLGTIFNESRRRVYLDIRRAIPKNILRKIEN